MKLLRCIRRKLCRHEFAIEDLHKTGDAEDSNSRVMWSCAKCGKAFYANYGLAISPKHGPMFRRENRKQERNQ